MDNVTTEGIPKYFLTIYLQGRKLEESLNFLQTSKFVTDSPNKLTEILLEITKFYIETLQSKNKEYIEETRDRLGIEIEVRRIADAFGVIHSYLRYIEACRPERTPFQIVLPLQMLINEIIPEIHDDLILIRPQWKYNFKYLDLMKDIEETFPPFNKQIKKGFSHIPIISFPDTEKENVLSLIALAHEIGHYFTLRSTPPLYQHQDVISKIKINMSKLAQYREIIMGRSEYREMPPLLVEAFMRIRLDRKIPIWLREISADICAARLFGPAYLFSAARLFSILHPPRDSPYPPNQKRLEEILNELNSEDGKLCWEGFYVTSLLVTREKELYLGTLEEISKRKPIEEASGNLEEMYRLEEEIIEEAIEEPMRIIRQKIRNVLLPLDKCFKPSKTLSDLISYLDNCIPPCQKIGSLPPDEQIFSIREILNAAWFYWKQREYEISTSLELLEEWNVFNRLSFRALELSHIHKSIREEEPIISGRTLTSETDRLENEEILKYADGKGVLTKKEILAYMKKPLSDALVIVPIIDPSQINGTSIDLRLGNKFIVMKRSEFVSIDLKSWKKEPKVQRRQKISQLQEEIYVDYGKKFILHPGEFALGSTLEYICLPLDLMGYILGKSTWGRMGLVIATATQVAPGYKGTPTLELSNLGTVPIELSPGLSIAQIVLHKTGEKAEPYKGSYHYSTGPSGPL